jgi:hypothetical protein
MKNQRNALGAETRAGYTASESSMPLSAPNAKLPTLQPRGIGLVIAGASKLIAPATNGITGSRPFAVSTVQRPASPCTRLVAKVRMREAL